MGHVGVLLLNLGGPDSLRDVQPFLYNLFADPEIIRLPVPALQKPLAWLISNLRAPKSIKNYELIGGGSPLRRITEEQAVALEMALQRRGQPVKTYIGMRYWHPYTEEAMARLKRDGVEQVVILPLYPQFSISTSGSSFKLLEQLWASDSQLAKVGHSVIRSWYDRPGYINVMAKMIARDLAKFPQPERVQIFFSAHGVPRSYVEDAGDPYQREIEACVALIMQALRQNHQVQNHHTLAYQSRVGPIEWLQPYTEDAIEELGNRGVKELLVVPISFISEHIETLQEIDLEYREVAEHAGIENFQRVSALNTEPDFIEDLADLVLETLREPPLTLAAANKGPEQPVLEYHDAWNWGFTAGAETWNGRFAMVGFVATALVEVATGQGFLHFLGLM
ncbi:ferrochelatase [Leptolyngbya sp. FACHB-261]|uniref:ferrochelatase n=1 Tax=Leptolyngbya sp. FACHB-261 TaxID=2692806 RepID=UPI001683BD3C|nr:ferrochelatase [Leptolyngbya sp. FACHB-261]MBD2099438.1 ferrochelatase [Leptolyngbya sp. FACHB-261]